MTTDSTRPKGNTQVKPLTQLTMPGPPLFVRHVAHADEYKLDGSQVAGTSDQCDVRVRDPEAGVSARHAQLTPDQKGLRVEDLGSTNGCWYDGSRTSGFVVSPGQTFRLGRATFVVLDERLHTLRAWLAWAWGWSNDAKVDEVFFKLSDDQNVSIIGEHCDSEFLAHKLHAVSRRQHYDFVELLPATWKTFKSRSELEGIKAAFLDLHGVTEGEVPGKLFDLLFDRATSCRVFISAPKLARYAKAIAQHVTSFTIVQPPALHVSKPDPLRVIEEVWRLEGDPMASVRALNRLREGNTDALRQHTWRKMADLRIAAQRLRALMNHKTLAEAADALGVGDSTLSPYFKELGIGFPGQRTKSEDDPAGGGRNQFERGRHRRR